MGSCSTRFKVLSRYLPLMMQNKLEILATSS